MRRGLLVSGAARCPFAEVQGSRGGLHLLCLKRASKLHLGLYFSSSTSDDERSQVPQGSSCWQPVVPAWLPGAEWGWFSAP